MDTAYESILDEIEDIATDPDLDESEKESEVKNILDAEELEVEDIHQCLDEEESEGDNGFVINPKDIDDDFD